MGRWQFFTFPKRAVTSSIAAYGIRDAKGRHVGHLAGWISDENGMPVLVLIRKAGIWRRGRFLLSAGCVSYIDFRQCLMQLRSLTVRDIRREGLELGDKLPSHARLQDYLQNFPKPLGDMQHSLASLLAEANDVESEPVWGSEGSDGYHGDGLPYLAEPRTLPSWKPLGTLIGSS